MTVAEQKSKGDTKEVDAEKEKAAKELLDEIKSEEAAESLSEEEKKKKEEEEAKSAEDKEAEEKTAEEKAAEAKESEGTPDGTGDGKKKNKSGFKRRESKLRKENSGLKGAVSKTEQELQAERDKRKLLELRVQQLETKKKEITEPNPDDFDGGVDDDAYIEQMKAFDRHQIKREIREEIAAVTKGQTEEQTKQQSARALQEKQDKHWDLAEEKCPSDFNAKEETVTELLGPDKVNMIIDNYPGESHKIVYYLGAEANAEEAEEINELLENRTSYVKAVTKIGRILAKIEANPNFTNSPDPDEQSEGSAPTHTESLQMQLDKMREDLSKSYSNEGFKRMRKFRKKAKERGITLR